MALKQTLLAATAALTLSIATPAHAETRAQCEARLKPFTTVTIESAKGGAWGTAGGVLGGILACKTFLLAFFLDSGLSYGICVSTVAGVGALAGSAVGTSVGEDKLMAKKEKCSELPDR